MGTGKTLLEGNPVMDWHPFQGEAEIIPVSPCYHHTRVELCLFGPVALVPLCFHQVPWKRSLEGLGSHSLSDEE